jgi:putative ABC transport system permease protein
MWAPLTDPTPGGAPRDRHYLSAIGLLKPGASIDSARAQLATVAQRLETANPITNKARGIRVETLSAGFEDTGLRPVLGFFELGAGLVLLIACVNVANFLLARGAERRREIAVRQALGAGGSRIMRQLLTEGLVTAVMSLAVAFPVAAFASRTVRGIMPAEIARFLNGWSNIGLDGRAVAFGIVLAALSALVFSLAPARRIASPQLTDALKEGGRANTEGGARQRGRDVLVVVQIASALALVLVASLATRSAWTLIEGPQGYEPAHVLGLLATLPEVKYPDADSRRTFARESAARLGEVTGAVSVAYANLLPAHNSNSSRAIRVEGGPALAQSELPSADARSVSSGYFDTLRIPILSGRAIDQRDDAADAPQVAVVSKSFADKYWPERDPLGQRFQAGDEKAPTVTVVGVSGDVIHQWFARRNYPTYYRPYAQEPDAEIAFAVRTAGEPEVSAKEARQAVARVGGRRRGNRRGLQPAPGPGCGDRRVCSGTAFALGRSRSRSPLRVGGRARPDAAAGC